MEIRPATPKDLPEIARLHEANWRRDYAGILPDLALGNRLGTYMADRWDAEALSRWQVCVAVHDDALLGFVAWVEDGSQDDLHDGAFIDNLHVAPVARAQGVGRALMCSVAALASPGPLALEVLSANAPARRIYRRWGGVESEEFDDEILGIKVPAVTVRWPSSATLLDRLSGATA